MCRARFQGTGLTKRQDSEMQREWKNFGVEWVPRDKNNKNLGGEDVEGCIRVPVPKLGGGVGGKNATKNGKTIEEEEI